MSTGNGKKAPKAGTRRRAAAAAPVASKSTGSGRTAATAPTTSSDTTAPPRPPPPTPPASPKPPTKPSAGGGGPPARKPPPTSPAAKPPPAPPTQPASRLFVVCISLLFIGAATAAGYYLLWQRLDRLEEQLTAFAQPLDRRLAALEDHGVTVDRLRVLEAEMAEMRLQVHAENLLWALAEIESLVILAMHRLDLQADVGGALAALAAAETRLEGLTDVGLLPVREQLRADMDALRAVDAPDLHQLSDRLINLYRGIRHLPHRKAPGSEAQSAPPPATQEDSGWLERLRRWIVGWVSVRRIEDPAELRYVGLGHEQAAGLIRLEIENARLSLQARDTRAFRAALGIIKDLLVAHYDTEQTSVRNTLDMLEQLQLAQLDPELPNLDSSIEALRAYHHVRFSGRP